MRIPLIDARKQRRWSQQEVADRLGTTRININRWEQGKTTPGPYFRTKLCELFGMSVQELGLLSEPAVEEQQLPALTHSPMPTLSPKALPVAEQSTPLWHVPYLRNPFFTGRNDVLQQLHEVLHHEHTAILSQSYALSGLGGIGKTQTALEYAYRYANDYAAVFWISAETAESLTSSFLALAHLLDLPEQDNQDQKRAVMAVSRWLTGHDRWLLIFDNVEDIELTKGFLPHTRSGSLLFTSHKQALGMGTQTLDLEKMTFEESMRFLLHRARLGNALTSPFHLSATEMAAAQEIVAAMDGLPLALDQAGAFIEATQCTLADYLGLLHTAPLHLLQEREAHAEHPLPVIKTFTLAFEQLERDHPSAAELLVVCAFLASEAIPEEFFLEGAAHLGATFEALAADPLLFQSTIKTLLAYSLIQRQAATHTLTIHRLVQIALKSNLSEMVQHAWITRVVQTMVALFPSTKAQIGYWQTGERLLPHALMCITMSSKQSEDMIALMNHVATYLYNRAQFSEAEALYQQALQLGEQVLDTMHPAIAKTLLGLANIYKDWGEYEKAEPFYQRALAIREQALGHEHPLTSAILNNLGLIRLNQGKYEQAEALFQRGVDITERTAGTKDPLLATNLNNLAIVYMDQEKYEQAEPLVQRALCITEQVLGSEHPQTAFPLTNLAEIYKGLGRYEAAEPLYQRALHIREQAQGSIHPDIAYLLSGLADLYRQQKEYEQAEALYQRALQMWEQTIGDGHPQIVDALQGLAKLFSEQGRYKQAEALYERALAIREQHLGSDHQLTAETLYGLASLYVAQGRDCESHPLYQRTFIIRERVFGSEHPKTIEARAKCLRER